MLSQTLSSQFFFPLKQQKHCKCLHIKKSREIQLHLFTNIMNVALIWFWENRINWIRSPHYQLLTVHSLGVETASLDSYKCNLRVRMKPLNLMKIWRPPSCLNLFNYPFIPYWTEPHTWIKLKVTKADFVILFFEILLFISQCVQGDFYHKNF